MRVLATLAFLVACICVALIAWAAPVQADEEHMEMYHASPEYDQWFRSLKTPYSGSCCSLNDCQRTEAEWKQGEDGAWAWYASVESYRGRITIQIPADRVLDQPKSIDGEAYVCNTPGSEGGTTYSPYTPGATEVPASDPHVYCFIPPATSY